MMDSNWEKVKNDVRGTDEKKLRMMYVDDPNDRIRNNSWTVADKKCVTMKMTLIWNIKISKYKGK